MAKRDRAGARERTGSERRARKSSPTRGDRAGGGSEPGGAVIEIGARGVLGGLLVVCLAIAAAWWLAAGRDGVTTSDGTTAASATVASSDSVADADHAAQADAPAASDTADASVAAATVPPLPAGAVAPQLDEHAWVTSDGYLAVGNAEAPLRIVAFLDYKCGLCGQFALEELPSLVGTWLSRGLAVFVIRDLAVLGDASYAAAQAAHCAGEQGRFLDYQARLFRTQDERDAFGLEHLEALAIEAGLDETALAECVSSGRYGPIVQASTQYGIDQGFEGTPVYVINGRAFTGAIELDRWNELFEGFEAEMATATATGSGG